MSQNRNSKTKDANAKDNRSKSRNTRTKTGKKNDRDASRTREEKHVSEPNDVIWYAKSEQLLKDAASLSFFNPIGNSLDWKNTHANEAYLAPSVPTALPGIEAIDVVPVPGISSDGLSPINVAANAIYSFVRHANSGHTNYEASDLMIYLLAVDNAYAFCSWMIRIYGTLMLYTQDNRYYPRALLEAQNLDWSDLRGHLNDYRAFLNQWIMRLSTIYVPAAFDVYNRHSWMFLGYYKDDVSLKGQTMLYNLAGYFKYDPTLTSSGGGLKYVARPRDDTHKWTFNDLVLHAQNILDPIVLDEDMNIMAGDILKAYGTEGIYKTTLIPDNFIVVPMYNEEVLYQMRHVVTSPGEYDIHDITQSNNVLYFTIDTQDESLAHNFKRVINFWDDNHEPARVMVSTRLMPVFDGGSVAVCGTEIPISVRIFTLSYPINSEALLLSRTVASFIITTEPTEEQFNKTSWVTQFRYAPYIYLISEPEQEKYVIAGVVGDISNYTLITDDVLTKLHNCALLSEFNVPRLAMT